MFRDVRLNLSGLVFAVGLLGLDLAGLAHPTNLLARAAFTVTVTLLLVSLLGAAFARGSRRAFWIGFAVVGWSCLAIRFMPFLEDFSGYHLVGRGSLASLAYAVHPTDRTPEEIVAATSDHDQAAQAQLDAVLNFQDSAAALLTMVLAWVGAHCARSFHKRSLGQSRSGMGVTHPSVDNSRISSS